MSNRSGDSFEIYTMEADGSNVKRLTNDKIEDASPAWSPDGTSIAFTHGGGCTYIDTPPSIWVPDGVCTPYLYIMSSDGTNPRKLSQTAGDSGPVWSPDGSQIAFTAIAAPNNPNSEIFVMNVDGSNRRRLTNNTAHDYVSSWSPDGRKLAFTSNRDADSRTPYVFEIYTMNADGSSQTRITIDRRDNNYPVFSPDGTKIAFQRGQASTNNPADNAEIFVMDPDGSNQTNITNNQADDFGPPTWQPQISGAINGNVGGTITDSNGKPVAGALIVLNGTDSRETITDANGNYNFLNVEANGFYTVTPSRANYSFSPANRSFSLLGVHTDASFTASSNGDNVNAIDTTEFFVRQQYLDFLGREPDPPGFIGWVNTIRNCAGDASCDRVHVSEDFFRSEEFQQRGYFVYRFYSTALGRKPDFAEFVPDMARVSGFLTNDQLEAAKTAFANDFTARAAFVNQYGTLTNAQYVDALAASAGVTLGNRQALVNSLEAGTMTRAQALRQIAESGEVYAKYYNQAFVVMEYFGYLRRDPDALYLDWIQILDANPADSRRMVEGFVDATEYRNRFKQ